MILLLAALTAASPAGDGLASGAAAPARSDDMQAQRQTETTEERIARIRARLGVRADVRGGRVSKVRCGGTATCADACKTDAAQAPTRELAVAGSGKADARANTSTCSKRGA
ncbi:MAG: hypothetical protein AAFO28_04870 [Pseudomonadota bacterium]